MTPTSTPTATHTAIPTFTISGNTGAAGVTLTYTGGTATSNGSGYYIFTIQQGWSGTVTPYRSGVNFSPASYNYTNVTSNQTNQDFTPDPVFHTISGTITDFDTAAGVSGVTLSFNDNGPQTVSTDSSGNYTLLVPDTWAGTVTPFLPGYTFNPVSRDYSITPVTPDPTNQNYIGTTYRTYLPIIMR